jgi:uncharacterized protein
MSKDVACPTCGKRGDWLGGNYPPFCSKRCKLVDLGKWLGEEHTISEPLQPRHFIEEEEQGTDVADGEDLS